MTQEPRPLEPARDGAETQAPISANTRRAYDAALRGFDGSMYPETDVGVAAYITGLYEGGRSPASAVMAVSALRFRAKLQGRPSPVGPAASRALAEFRRLAAERGRGEVAGVGWEEADRAAAMAGETGTPAGLRDAAIVAVASDALLRVSEVSALDVADVNLDEQTVLIRRGETDREDEGVVQFLGGPTVERIRAWLAGSGITQGALFRAFYKGGRLREGRLTERSVRSIIARWGRAAGAEGRVSGHSLRVGGAQSLASAGASLAEMQAAGRWRSPAMPGRYAQEQPAERDAVKRLRYGK